MSDSEDYKKILFKYWDKIGHVKYDKWVMHTFSLRPRDYEMVHSFVWEWYKTREIDPIKPLRDDFKLEERDNGVFVSDERKSIDINGDGYSATINLYGVHLDYEDKLLEISFEIDLDSVLYNGETPYPDDPIDFDEIGDDTEYWEAVNKVRDDLSVVADEYFTNKYGNPMGVDLELEF
jgi:hypothetical protein